MRKEQMKKHMIESRMSKEESTKTLANLRKVKNKLRVLHYPQIPCTPFFVDVKDEEQALLIRETLADQHLFLYDNNFIPDYANVITVVMWDEDERDWVNYWNEEECMEFDEFVEAMGNRV